MIQVEKQENAEKALAALKKGDSAKTVAKKYGKTGTYDGSEKSTSADLDFLMLFSVKLLQHPVRDLSKK